MTLDGSRTIRKHLIARMKIAILDCAMSLFGCHYGDADVPYISVANVAQYAQPTQQLQLASNGVAMSVAASGLPGVTAERAVKMAQQAFPGPASTPGEIFNRSKYIYDNRWLIFDPQGTGLISRSTYLEYAWAMMLVNAAPNATVLDRDDYLASFLGPPPLAAKARAVSSAMFDADVTAFKMLDRGNKGYITRSDMRTTFDHDFSVFDKNGDGFLNHAEFF